MSVTSRQSAHALYDERFVTFGEDDVYQQSDAAGFIRLFSLPNRVRALKDQEMAAAESAPAVPSKNKEAAQAEKPEMAIA
jgi:argininosuccinate synthase